MGQGLLHGDDIVDIAVVVVVDDGQGGALHVHDIVHISAVNGHFLIVVVILGGLIGGQASALQQGGQGVVVLGVAAGDLLAGLNDGVHVGDHRSAIHGGVGQNGGLLHVHGDGLTQHINRSADIEDLGLHVGAGILGHGGVAGGGQDAVGVVDAGLALLQRGIGVVVQDGPLIGGDNALHLDHAILVGQDGAVIAVNDGVVVGGVALDHLHVQGVVDQQGRVVAVQGSGQILGEPFEDALLVGADGHVDGPVGALKALDSGVVAHGHQQHLGRLQGGHGGGGVKLAVAAAGDDAGGPLAQLVFTSTRPELTLWYRALLSTPLFMMTESIFAIWARSTFSVGP